MIKAISYLNTKKATIMAAFTLGMFAQIDKADAQLLVNAGGNNFSDVAENITDSLSLFPGLISGLAYLVGLGFGVLGLLKIKDHVDNPTQTQLKDGAIRLAAGGSLFALPIIFEAATNTIGVTNSLVGAAPLSAVDFAVIP